MSLYMVSTEQPVTVLVDGKITIGRLVVDDDFVEYGLPKKVLTCDECGWWGDDTRHPDARPSADPERAYCPEFRAYPKYDNWCFRAVRRDGSE